MRPRGEIWAPVDPMLGETCIDDEFNVAEVLDRALLML